MASSTDERYTPAQRQDARKREEAMYDERDALGLTDGPLVVDPAVLLGLRHLRKQAEHIHYGSTKGSREASYWRGRMDTLEHLEKQLRWASAEADRADTLNGRRSWWAGIANALDFPMVGKVLKPYLDIH